MNKKTIKRVIDAHIAHMLKEYFNHLTTAHIGLAAKQVDVGKAKDYLVTVIAKLEKTSGDD